MKKLYALVALICFGPGVYAGSAGGTSITSWEIMKTGSGTSNNEILYQICLSNIIDQPVSVTVALITGVDGFGNPTYYLDGDNNPSTGKIFAYGSYSNYAESPAGGSVSLTIPAQQTIKIVVTPGSSILSSSIFGYGKITWSTSASNAAVALVGNIRCQHNNPDSRISITLLNNGNPF